jgi:hypothetical protein
LEDIIIDGTNWQPSFTQQEAKAYAEYEEEGDDVGWENDVYTYAEAPEEIAPAVADPKGKKKMGATASGADPKKAGGRGPKWSLREDECLAEAWKMASIDPFTDANQNAEFYWIPISRR